MQIWFNVGDVVVIQHGKLKLYGRVLRCRTDLKLDVNVWDPTTERFAIKNFAKEQMRLANEVEKEILRQKSIKINLDASKKFNGRSFVRNL